MNNDEKPSPKILRKAILQLEEPVLFKGFLNNDDPDNNWKLLKLSNLTKLISDNNIQKFPFRVGQNACTPEPQWDISCPVVTISMLEFMNKIQNGDESKWYYFDYKYMKDWFKTKSEILNCVNWRYFGFDMNGEDSTLWIGSKGAHTNCHQDSYGCNLVAQLDGRKQWLLFPPNSGSILRETRVPYEESTIYSKINFFCPSKDDVEYIMKSDIDNRLPKLIILDPGDVLLVPRGWWHYVESLDVTVSVNVWLPLDVDYEARIKEALVKLIISGLGEGLPTAHQSASTFQTCLRLVEESTRQYHELNDKIDCQHSEKKMKEISWDSQNLHIEYPAYVKKLDNLSKDTLREFLISNRTRFPNFKENSHNESKIPPSYQLLECIVDTICHSDNINKLANVIIAEK